MRTKQRKLFIVRQRPRYVQSTQQDNFRQVAAECGIKKGITRDELIAKMIHCVPEAWKKIRKKQTLSDLEALKRE